MERLGEEVLTLAADHVVEAVAALGADLAVALAEDLVDQVLLVGGQVQGRILQLQTAQADAAAHDVEVVQRLLEYLKGWKAL